MGKVHVIGAGPAGSIAAISAIRSGFDVTVSEEHASAGIPRNCSGLFSKDGLESLTPFLDYRKHVLNTIKGARISFDKEVFSVRRNNPVAFVCDRSGMDRTLAGRAESEGARMHFGERITSSYKSGNIIGADGPLSLTARHFGFPQIRRHAGTLQAHIPYAAKDPHMIEMLISNSRFPGFFAWVIPQDESYAEFGVGVELPHRPILAWNHLMDLKGIRKPPKPRGFVIPLSPRKSTAKRHGGRNILLAGDAAGQVKSTTGGGVIFGGMCAAIAGRHAENPARYELEWRLRYGADLALHRMIHSFISSRSDAQLSAFCRRIKKLNLDSYLSHHGHMDRPTRMMGPQLVAHIVRNIWGVV
ncbi:MAG: NAD(P)/FAD-dependent oxidoreductase [Candidatus Micrarchaeota archaeon]